MTASGRDRWRRAFAVAVLAPTVAGCFTGQLFAYGRRREYATEILAAVPAKHGTAVRYAVDVTDDDGRPLGTDVRAACVAAPPDGVALDDLTRTRTEPWVYPMVPFALVLDALAVPFLVVMSPAVLIVGD